MSEWKHALSCTILAKQKRTEDGKGEEEYQVAAVKSSAGR